MAAGADGTASISTHVLNTATGQPGRGLRLSLHRAVSDDHRGEYELVGEYETNDDGRVKDLPRVRPGVYRIVFELDDYFGAGNSFYPDATVKFRVAAGQHYHVPGLVSGFSFTTYRGS